MIDGLVDGVAVPVIDVNGAVISRQDRSIRDVIQERDAVGARFLDRIRNVRDTFPFPTVDGSVPGNVRFINGRWVLTTSAPSAKLMVTMELMRKPDNGNRPKTPPVEANGRE